MKNVVMKIIEPGGDISKVELSINDYVQFEGKLPYYYIVGLIGFIENLIGPRSCTLVGENLIKITWEVK